MNDDNQMQDIYEALLEEGYKDSVFVASSKLSKEEFIDKMKGEHKQWLQPHYLRQQVFLKVTGASSSSSWQSKWRYFDNLP